ncbi:MAG: hypothetical protein IKK82_11440 [Kiritimatiellae bacterium]|nr:hypothetical protein [Kiritimatiellia bacterium]
MKNDGENGGKFTLTLKLSMLMVSLVANAVLVAYLVREQIEVRRNFSMMRILAGEYSLEKVKENIGVPHRVFAPGEEIKIHTLGLMNERIPKIKDSAYLYSTPEKRYLIYVDKDGFVDNVFCR